MKDIKYIYLILWFLCNTEDAPRCFLCPKSPSSLQHLVLPSQKNYNIKNLIRNVQKFEYVNNYYSVTHLTTYVRYLGLL